MKKSAVVYLCGFIALTGIFHSCSKEDFSDPSGTFTDLRDNKEYEWVRIGDQVWMAENLAYLPSVNTSKWDDSCYMVYGYEGSSVSEAKATDNYKTFGVLYNWPTAMNACPDGWHLPGEAEWTQLIDYLGGESAAGGKLKETGTSHWASPNEGATNETGFTALPGGHYDPCCGCDFGWPSFENIGNAGYWWTSTLWFDIYYFSRSLDCSSLKVDQGAGCIWYHLSVRCVQGPSPPIPPIADFDAERTIVTIDQGANVQFIDQSTNNPTFWNWNFGDGTSSAEKNPNHSYTASGTYTVSLRVNNKDGADTQTKSDYITVTPGITTETGTYTDSRDGKTYKTVTIGIQTWIAENMAYLPLVSPSSEGSLTDPFYYVYDYQSSSVSEAKATNNYQTYGVLYNWPAALDACPSGWHLPSDGEWTQLTDYLTENGYYDQGTVLKSTSLWYGDGNGTDNLSFTALPGGNRGGYGLFFNFGGNGYWWSASEASTSRAWYRFMYYDNSGVSRDYSNGKGNGFSVRCLRN